MTRIQALSPTPHSPASDDFEERLAKHVEKICEIAGAREYLRGWIIGKQVGREEMLLEVLSLRFRPLTCAENTRVREACNEGQAVVEDMLRLQHWMTCSRSPYVRRRKRRPVYFSASSARTTSPAPLFAGALTRNTRDWSISPLPNSAS
jgi:hypothetical protein